MPAGTGEAAKSAAGIATGDARWFIAECKPTRERTLRQALTRFGYETFVCSQTETHRYKSRNTRVVERIILPGKLFVHTEETRLMDIMLNFSGVYRFQKNRAAALDANGLMPFAYVPEPQMEQLKYMLGHAPNPVHFTAEQLKVNQRVRVLRGLLAGLEGWFEKVGQSSCIIIKVEMGSSHYVYTELPTEDVQPIE